MEVSFQRVKFMAPYILNYRISFYPANSKQCQINTANRFSTTRMHEWCEKAFNSSRRVAAFRCKGV